jgi:hypothetical protein
MSRVFCQRNRYGSLLLFIHLCLCTDMLLCFTFWFSFHSDVHNAEFVLTGVLTQTLDYESYPFWKSLCRGWVECAGGPPDWPSDAFAAVVSCRVSSPSSPEWSWSLCPEGPIAVDDTKQKGHVLSVLCRYSSIWQTEQKIIIAKINALSMCFFLSACFQVCSFEGEF